MRTTRFKKYHDAFALGFAYAGSIFIGVVGAAAFVAIMIGFFPVSLIAMGFMLAAWLLGRVKT